MTRALYFDDFIPGFTFTTASRTLTEDDIVTFARQYDPQPFHLDADAARASIYGGIIASGFHTLTTAFALSLETGLWTAASMGSPGMQEVRWIKPVSPGDTLTVQAEVTGSDPSQSRPDMGRTHMLYQVYNQSGDLVMRWDTTHLLKRQLPVG